jgi:hypothetical protein
VLGDGGRSQESLWHDGRMMVANLPLSIFPYINEGITALDLISSGTHGKLVDS